MSKAAFSDMSDIVKHEMLNPHHYRRSPYAAGQMSRIATVIERKSFAKAAKECGVSRERIHQLYTVIKERALQTINGNVGNQLFRMSVEEFCQHNETTTRLENCLVMICGSYKKAGAMKRVLSMTRDELLEVPNLGVRTLKELDGHIERCTGGKYRIKQKGPVSKRPRPVRPSQGPGKSIKHNPVSR